MDDMHLDKTNRILFLYTKLLQGQLLIKSELAQLTGVNEKSIQRDLEDIRDFLDKRRIEEGYGSQLIYDYREKGYCLEQSSQLRLSNDEVLAISKILLESRAFTKKEMMNILDKLVENCIPRKDRAAVNDMLNNERFHYMELRHHKAYLDRLTPLSQAIRESRVICIKYGKIKGNAIVERRIEPLAILFSEYYFYLVGFIEDIDREEAFENPDDIFPTIYRIDRIETLEVLDEHFKIPYANRFEEGEFRKRVQFMYGGKLQRVRFKYTGLSVEAILDRLPTAKILSEEDGAYLIEAEVFGKGIDMWVRSQGDNITEYTVV
jgi:predicted DNA-binding transcriptional regulator YafY